MTEHRECASCPDCQETLANAKIFYECARLNRLHEESIRDEIAAMFAEAKQIAERTIELNRRAVLDAAPTYTAN